MSKPIIFQIEISGYQNVRIDDDYTGIRPPTASEVAHAAAYHLKNLMNDEHKSGELEIKVKRIS